MVPKGLLEERRGRGGYRTSFMLLLEGEIEKVVHLIPIFFFLKIKINHFFSKCKGERER